MIRMPGEERGGAVNLLEEHHLGQGVRQLNATQPLTQVLLMDLPDLFQVLSQ